MYAEYFGFRTDPFHVTPDASLLFLTKAHREAIGVLEYGLRVRKGFVVITGEVGVGKTTVLRHSLRRLDARKSAIVYVLQPMLTPHQLVTFIWEELNGETNPVAAPWMADSGELIRRLLFKLKSLHDTGKLIVIVIDEAQNMPVETLESLRLLSNLESDKHKFLQIVLAGQTELEAKLARHELRQLNQRIAVRTRIDNLGADEAKAYIQFRLDMASGRHVDIFTPRALDYIVAAARGNPRRLNIFCDNALINAMGHRAQRVTREIAEDAIAPHLSQDERVELPGLPAWMVQNVPQSSRMRYVALGIGALALGGLIGALGMNSLSGAGSPPPARSVSVHIAPAPVQVATLPREDQPIADTPPRAPVAVKTANAPATVLVPPVATYKVENQDSLAQLCQLVYGICGANMLTQLAHANPTIDPKRLVSGQIVSLPVIENLTPVVP